MREFGWLCASLLVGMVAGGLLAAAAYWLMDGALSRSAVQGIMWGVVALFAFEGGRLSQHE